MSRQRIMLIVLLVLVVAGGFVLFRQLRPRPTRAAAEPTPPAAVRRPRLKVDTTSVTVDTTRPAAVNWGRDPFEWLLEKGKEPTGEVATKLAALKLRAISLSSRGSFVLVDDYVLRVGDEIEGARVASIEKDRVVLRYDDHEYVLILGEGE